MSTPRMVLFVKRRSIFLLAGLGLNLQLPLHLESTFLTFSPSPIHASFKYVHNFKPRSAFDQVMALRVRVVQESLDFEFEFELFSLQAYPISL